MVEAEGLFVEHVGKQPYIGGVTLSLRQYDDWNARLYANPHSEGGDIAANGETPELAISNLAKLILDLPRKEETEMRVFQAQLGALIDKGREYGIDVAYVNPLSEMAKALAENAITDQRAKK